MGAGKALKGAETVILTLLTIGLIGLLLSHNPDLTPADIVDIVKSTANIPVADQGVDGRNKPNMINFYKSIF